MPQFVYQAIESSGRRTSGTMAAVSTDAALKILHSRDVVVMRLKQEYSIPLDVLSWLHIRQSPLNEEQRVAFTRQLASMLAAGVMLQSALQVILKETQEPAPRALLEDLATGLLQGESLSAMLGKHPECFSKQYVALVTAGEATGSLPEMLYRIAKLLEDTATLRRKVRSGMYYPAFVISFAILIVAGILVFGVPRFQALYNDLGAELPLPTQIVVGAGHSLGAVWPYLLAGLVLGAYGVRRYAATPRGRLRIDTIKLGLPVLGDLWQKLAIAHFSRTLATLEQAGVPTIESLHMVAESVGNAVMAQVVMTCVTDVSEGGSLVATLRRSGWFTEMSTGMMTVGEQSGTMDVMLEHVARFYEDQVEVALRGLISLLEPAVIVFVGLAIGFIAIAMLLPIFDMASHVM